MEIKLDDGDNLKPTSGQSDANTRPTASNAVNIALTSISPDLKMDRANLYTFMHFHPKTDNSFQDIENLIHLFAGTKTGNIIAWQTYFKALANPFSFSEIQKFIVHVQKRLLGARQRVGKVPPPSDSLLGEM